MDGWVGRVVAGGVGAGEYIANGEGLSDGNGVGIGVEVDNG